MSIYAISDFHLDGGQNKAMDVFGKNWENHAEKIKNNWLDIIKEEDLVLISGDISWAMKLEDAKPDLDLIGNLPGKKVMIKGNHDFWHDSLSKTRNVLDGSIYFLQNDVYCFEDYVIAGTRGWKQKGESGFNAEDEKIYKRELGRLKMSLDIAKKKDKKIIVMMHYPPYSFKKDKTEFTELISQYNVECVVFGHIHGYKKEMMMPENRFEVDLNDIKYILTSCDYIDFKPVLIK